MRATRVMNPARHPCAPGIVVATTQNRAVGTIQLIDAYTYDSLELVVDSAANRLYVIVQSSPPDVSCVLFVVDITSLKAINAI